MNNSPTIDRMPDEIRRMQEIKLQELLRYLNGFSPWYQKIFRQNQIDLQQIRRLEDLSLLPVTVK